MFPLSRRQDFFELRASTRATLTINHTAIRGAQNLKQSTIRARNLQYQKSFAAVYVLGHRARREMSLQPYVDS